MPNPCSRKVTEHTRRTIDGCRFSARGCTHGVYQPTANWKGGDVSGRFTHTRTHAYTHVRTRAHVHTCAHIRTCQVSGTQGYVVHVVRKLCACPVSADSRLGRGEGTGWASTNVYAQPVLRKQPRRDRRTFTSHLVVVRCGWSFSLPPCCWLVLPPLPVVSPLVVGPSPPSPVADSLASSPTSEALVHRKTCSPLCYSAKFENVVSIVLPFGEFEGRCESVSFSNENAPVGGRY